MQYINNIDKIILNKNLLSDNCDKEIKQNKYEIEKTNKTIEIMNKTYDKKLEEISDQIKELYDYNQTVSNKIKEIDTILSSFQNDLNKIKKRNKERNRRNK